MERQLLAAITASLIVGLAPGCTTDKKSDVSDATGATVDETNATASTASTTFSSTTFGSSTLADAISSSGSSTGWRDGLDCPAPLGVEQLPTADVGPLFHGGDRPPPYLGSCQAGPLSTEVTIAHPSPTLTLVCELDDGPGDFLLEAHNIDPIRPELEALQEYETLELFTLGGNFGLYDLNGNIVLFTESQSLRQSGGLPFEDERIVDPPAGWMLVGGSDTGWRAPFGPLFARDLGCAERGSTRFTGGSEIPWAFEFESDDGLETIYDGNAKLVRVSGIDYRVFVRNAFIDKPNSDHVGGLYFMIARAAEPK